MGSLEMWPIWNEFSTLRSPISKMSSCRRIKTLLPCYVNKGQVVKGELLRDLRGKRSTADSAAAVLPEPSSVVKDDLDLRVSAVIADQ